MNGFEGGGMAAPFVVLAVPTSPYRFIAPRALAGAFI
jgi:hypothetical protein